MKKGIDALYGLIMGVVRIILRLTPYGVLAIMARTVATSDLGAIVDLGKFVIASYVALIVMFLLHLVIVALTGLSPLTYAKKTAEALLFAFTSRSSAGTLPLNIQTQTKRLGISEGIANFAGSFGLSIGQNGCAGIYPAMLAVMIAPTVGIDPLSPGFIATLILVVAISSFGVAGVGGGATFAAIIVLSAMDLPIALAGDLGFGFSPEVIKSIAAEIKDVIDLGVEVALVVGGGNIWRGKIGAEMGMERANADYMGMLGTVMNALALQDSLENLGVPTRVQSSIVMTQVAEPYIRRKAVRHLEKSRVVIFAAGTGNPYFSTDTTAALRAAEINADAILMAKNNVDGIYSADPKLDATAVKYDTLTYLDVIQQGLQVMDSTASTLCMDNDIKLVVFNLSEEGNIKRAVMGEKIGTVVRRDA